MVVVAPGGEARPVEIVGLVRTERHDGRGDQPGGDHGDDDERSGALGDRRRRAANRLGRAGDSVWVMRGGGPFAPTVPGRGLQQPDKQGAAAGAVAEGRGGRLLTS